MNENEAQCRHLWEGEAYGRECCALCGVVVERAPTSETALEPSLDLFGQKQTARLA